MKEETQKCELGKAATDVTSSHDTVLVFSLISSNILQH